MNLFLALLKKWRKPLRLALLLVIISLPIIAMTGRTYQFWDNDAERGAATVQQDVFGDNFTRVKYLDQGWKPADSLWFYTTTQGSDMMPYDFFMVLEQVGSSELFRSNENMNRYRYLPQKATFSNPDALPVGFVKDDYQGKEYIGLTCAACHTGQINYRGVGIRIDGGPAGSDMETFLLDLVRAMQASLNDDNTRKRFIQNVLARGTYTTENEVFDDLKKFSQRLATYTVVNRSPTDYGYARLDAFGRIYNRVLEHVVSVKQLNQLLRDVLTEEELKALTKDVGDVMSGDQRDHIVERLAQLLSPMQLARLRHKLFNPANAPVSYPFLWDIPQHDYVQWNGLASNAGLGPVGRNTGEAIGVFGTLDWAEKKGFSLSSLIGGQGFDKTYINFKSSINVRNLRRLESHLIGLHSPQWPKDIFPAIDQTRLLRGEKLFNRYCVSCHAEIDRADPDRRVVAHITKVSDVGTDPQMADNSIRYDGYSGILRNLYVGVGVGDILLDQRAPVAAILTKATLSVVATPDPDKIFVRRWAEWAYDLVTAFFNNEIKPSIKRGGYNPDTTVHPFASLQAYKARSLNGIWATAPYLHNGSVPTLYDLLLPKKHPGDAKEGEFRPDEFVVGSREFDPVKVGITSSGYLGFIFKTGLKGNSNAGHEYAARRTALPDGEMLPAMNKEQRLDLLEYLKTL